MFRALLIIFASLCVVINDSTEASDPCGFRRSSLLPLVHRGHTVEEADWPWHVGLFHKTSDGSPEYKCGGTLLDRKHVLTAAHCVWNENTRNPLAAAFIELHFGQQNLSDTSNNVQIRNVSTVHIHPQFSTHRNDIAVLIMESPVNYTDYVIPICLDLRAGNDSRNFEGKRGWITGWGATDSGNISDVLWAASMPVVRFEDCLKDDRDVFGFFLDDNVFCAGDRNGTSPGTGDSGGGMYFLEGNRWMLRGIVSYAKKDEMNLRVDTSKFTVFVNVQLFLTWINGFLEKSKRISERECGRFQQLVQKTSNGTCTNSGSSFMAVIIDRRGESVCSGSLVNENYVITTASCVRFYSFVKEYREELNVSIKVQLGEFNHDIWNITYHPKYEEEYGLLYYDLAIIKLKTAIQLSNTMVPACLASNWTENLNDRLLLTGIDDEESDNNQIMSPEEYKRLSGFDDESKELGVRALCVIRKEELEDNKRGSALKSVNNRTCMHTVVGVLNGEIVNDIRYRNRNKEEEKKNYTYLFTGVAQHLDWIEQIVWNV